MAELGAKVDPRVWATPPPRGVRKYLPILTWLPSYDRSWLRPDVIAGVTIWGLLVLHDGEEREFAYTAGAETSLEQAKAQNWTVVSIKDDWATVFADA